jgi:hypothetical protein
MIKLKYLLERLRWIKILWSPFKPFKVSFYAGKTQVGIPYFLPRKWVKATPERAYKAASDEIESQEKWNKLNPEHARKVKLIGEVFQEKLNYRFAVPLKVGFSYCSLGWKTKWTSEDFRHEWNPVLSFVFFGYQIALTFYSPYHSHYWEPWLYYEYATDKTKSKRERIEQCRKECNQMWTVYTRGDEEGMIDYYEFILKPKYLK